MFKTILATVTVFLILNAVNFASHAAEIGKTAPNFTLKDSKGNTHSLSNFVGKWVVLEWINFDCPFVVKHYKEKHMQNLQQYYADRGVIWLNICSSAPGKQGYFTSKQINKRIADWNMKSLAYLIDEDGKVGKLYGAKTTPHMYIISPEGKLLYQGAIDDKRSTDPADIPNSVNYVETGLDEAMSGKEITNKTTTPYGCSVKY